MTQALGDGGEHGLLLRLTGARRIAAARANVAAAGFWVQHVPAEHAARMREREPRRPLRPGDPGPRVVLTCYGEDAAELVVVARRGALDHDGLRALAHSLAAPERAVPPSAVSTNVRRASRRPSFPLAALPIRPSTVQYEDEPAPCQPKPGSADRPTNIGGHRTRTGDDDAVVVLAATAVALSRYERTGTVRVAAVCPRATVLEVAVDDALPVADLLDAVHKALDGEPAPGERPSVCVVHTGEAPDEEYVSFPPNTFPLVLSGAGRLRGQDAEAFHPVVADGFCRHVRHIAAQLSTSCPNRTVGDLELLDPDEAAAAVELGRTPRCAPEPTTAIHDALTRHVRTRPDAVAISDGTTSLTYRELDERATAWARVLAEHGAAPGRFVGVCLKRTADLVVALLAVLRSGAAYVPLDVHSPDERLRYIAEDAGLALVITTLSGFPAAAGTTVLRPSALAAASDAALPEVTPGDAAYVIYTSGTTGRPKGVVVPHGNVMSLVDATAADLGLGPDDVWTFFHSVAFDFSVWEIWGCLLTGGRLVVVPYLVSRDPAELRALLARERVTVLSQTPSAFAALSEVDESGPAPRLVVFGGETLDRRITTGWRSRHPDCRLVNMYGITETTVHVTAADVRPGHERSRDVGRAVPGWSVSIRDGRGRPLPPGALGEIHVGGAGLAARYLNRPELTAERFITDPLGGERLYRSGDLGRLRPDGALDYVGRLDDQVKIRGFRIEFGEVRSVLLEDPGVADAAVVLDGQDAGPAHLRLVAYVVLAPGATAAGVRGRIARILPDYMMPAELLDLPALPLTLNGKLDRAALPRRIRPSTVDEKAPAMLTVWRAVTGRDVGPDDHFFHDVGGNSLLALRLLTALAKAGFGTLSLRDLYRHPTPASLRACLIDLGRCDS